MRRLIFGALTVRAWSLAILGALEPVLSARQVEQGNRAVREFPHYVRVLVAERRRHPGDPAKDALHLAFGFGVHQCTGLKLARLDARVAILRFVRGFPDYELTAPPVRGGRARFRGFLALPMRVT